MAANFKKKKEKSSLTDSKHLLKNVNASCTLSSKPAHVDGSHHSLVYNNRASSRILDEALTI